MRNWELARSQRHTAIEPREPADQVEDFICISRQVGAEGKRVAEALSERLGWPVFDREILDVMAGDDTVRRQIYKSMDGRDLSWWEEALRSLMQSGFVRNDYFRKLSETVLSLARQSNCILLGRGADLLLPASMGFRVRLAAPLAVRVSRLADMHCLTANEAKQYIERMDTERLRYFRNHFGATPDDPTRFDIVITLGRFTCDEAAELILKARSLREAVAVA
jgi:cytidylate kinase